MKKKDTKKKNKSDSPDQVSAAEAKKRMKAFVDRREQFVSAVKAGKSRGVSA